MFHAICSKGFGASLVAKGSFRLLLPWIRIFRGLPADSAGSGFPDSPFISVDTDLPWGLAADSTASMCCLVISARLIRILSVLFFFLCFSLLF